MTDPPHERRPTLRSLAGVPIGLFVLWQLGFLVVANLDVRIESGSEDVPTRASRRWERLSGQYQQWGLFAANAWKQSCFPAVELHWSDGRPPVRLSAINEPSDPHRFFRAGLYRIRPFESYLAVPLTGEGRSPNERATHWKQEIRQLVWDRHDYMLNYLRWRLARWRAEHPDDQPPAAVILRVRTWNIPPPPGPSPWTWTLESDLPVARWWPGVDPPPRVLELEVYDPVGDNFYRLEAPAPR
jgi:hypothetical protein